MPEIRRQPGRRPPRLMKRPHTSLPRCRVRPVYYNSQRAQRRDKTRTASPLPTLPRQSVKKSDFGAGCALTPPGLAYLGRCAAAMGPSARRGVGRGALTAEMATRCTALSLPAGPEAPSSPPLGLEPIAPHCASCHVISRAPSGRMGSLRHIGCGYSALSVRRGPAGARRLRGGHGLAAELEEPAGRPLRP